MENNLCLCGCGQLTNVNRKGEPYRFIKYHHLVGANNPRWKGGKHNRKGYVHERIGIREYKPEHIVMAENALGKPLPPSAEVHHHNGEKGDNSRCNLVVCQDRGYHFLLHQRSKAYKACGHASWRKCVFCKEYDDPTNLVISKSKIYHKKCNAADMKKRREANGSI